jgi:hypothetical protein
MYAMKFFYLRQVLPLSALNRKRCMLKGWGNRVKPPALGTCYYQNIPPETFSKPIPLNLCSLLNGIMGMADRLYNNWVYGGTMAGLLLVFLAPLFLPALSMAGQFCYLALALYMLHQFEEHDADRFRLFVNTTVARGKRGLTPADVFIINVPGVWGVIALSMWLAERVAPGWALIAIVLLLVNGIAHGLQAAAMRQANPGLWTALALFIPASVWMLIQLWPLATLAQALASLAIVLAIHAGIMVRAMASR